MRADSDRLISVGLSNVVDDTSAPKSPCGFGLFSSPQQPAECFYFVLIHSSDSSAKALFLLNHKIEGDSRREQIW